MTWQILRDELDRWRDAGITARLWLRDDDAIAPTPALHDFAALTARYRIPALLAIIPARTGEPLAQYLCDLPHLTPAVHGWSHTNHVRAGEKKCELGLERGREIVLGELAKALRRMSDLHGERLIPMVVPPWNRIATELVPELPRLGYRALSVFGSRTFDVQGLAITNTHVDLIDFRGTRACRDHDLLARHIADELSRSRLADREPVGILSHHCIGDVSALQFLEKLFSITADDRACRWVDARDLIRSSFDSSIKA